MAIELRPTVGQDPVRSQTGGLNGRVEPMRDPSAGSLLAVGAGMQDLGRAVTVAADRFQDQVDTAQSLRHRNLFGVEVENELLSPDNGFLTTSGMDANKERRKQSFDRLREKRKSIEALAQNDAQRLNFAEYADRAEAEANLRADVHQEREAKHFLAGETKVSAALGIKRGIQLHGTDEGELAVAGAMQDIDKLADLYGWPEDSKLRADMKQDANDILHAGVIDQYTQDPQGAPQAAAYLAQHRGEMSPNVLRRAVDDVQRATKIGQQQRVDAAAWAGANNLAESGKSIDDQRIDIDRGVRMGVISPDVALKMWSLAQNFDSQKRESLRNEQIATKEQVEQDFAKNPGLGVDMMLSDAVFADKIDRLGLRGDLPKIHNEVRLKRLADQVGEGSLDSLVLARDMRSIGEMRQMVTFLGERSTSIIGEEAKSPAGKEKKARLDAVIKKTEADIEALLMRPRTFVTRDDLPTPMPNNAPAPTAPTPIDMKKFAEEMRKALYPGSGR